MIGNEAHAEFIANIPWWGMEDVNGDLDPNDAPEGWEYIGSGCHRHAFKGPDGFVYKVMTRDAREFNVYASDEQAYAYAEFIEGKTFEGFRFARIDYFADSNVGVCEFINGRRPYSTEMGDISHKVFAAFGRKFNTDIHTGNVLIVDDELVVIDF